MGVLDYIYPKRCFGCGKQGSYLCVRCRKAIPRSNLICPECKKASPNGTTHNRCRNTFSADGLLSIWKYEEVIRKMLGSIKYRYSFDVCDSLVEAADTVMEEECKRFLKEKRFCFVSAYFGRKKWRGFDHVEVISDKLCNRWGMRTEKIVERVSFKKPQVGLGAKQRRENVKDNFVIKEKVNGDWVVFDDVYTSGATTKEVAGVLRKAGAKSVWILTLAR
jgi:ComF family protein